jgi:hypothetical protein
VGRGGPGRNKETRMVPLTELWLPILVSAAILFVASAILWMALPIHKNDYKKLGGKEGQVLETMRGIEAGMYMFPACDPKTMKNDAAAQERFKAGPWGVVSVMAKPWNMGTSLSLWLVNLLIVGFFIAYVASHALPAGAEYLSIFRIVGATALLAYGGNAMTDCIWKGIPWSRLPGSLLDSVVYALLTAGTFAWLWPDAAAPALPGIGG